jgi:arylsulfatase
MKELNMNLPKRVLAAVCILIFGAVGMSCSATARNQALQSEASFNGKIAINAKDSVPDWPSPPTAPEGAPNVVLILLDDVGFGDIGTFGGPARTPALDRLAAEGLRYNRFHTSGVCAPTRAALLSGRNQHRVGWGSFGGGGYPGYNGIWKKNAASIAEVLKSNGYSTAAFGKWHSTPLDEVSPVGSFDRWPTSRGFEYFFGNMHGNGSQWEPQLWRNTVKLPLDPMQSGVHLTTRLTDEAIAWMDTHQTLAAEKPYFIYFATEATHVPHHVGKEWIEKYRGQFDQGWDVLREQIFARQKKLGVIPADAKLTPRPKELPAWKSLSADQRRLLARQMEVYAAFVEHTDHEVGRLLQAVRESPHADNTLILYIVGDNGGNEPRCGINGADNLGNHFSGQSDSLDDQLERMDELGGPLNGWSNCYSIGWAWAGNTPFQWTKEVASHFGGTRNPLLVSWPERIKDRGGLRSQFSHVTDVATTVYAAAGIKPPEVFEGERQLSLDGISLLDSFDQPNAPGRHVQYFEFEGNRAIYQDGWIAAARHFIPWVVTADNALVGPDGTRSDFNQDRWELYHIDRDFSEANDLATQYPGKLMELQALFDTQARLNDVYPLGGGCYAGNCKPKYQH